MINFNRKKHSNKTLTTLYKNLLEPRLIEEKMLLLLRRGKLTKWFSGIGQEAISAGAVTALKNDEYILPLHRNLGVFTGRNVPLTRLIAQFRGKKSGLTKGRDRSFHFGSKEHAIVGMISHLGAQLPVADGIALAEKLLGNKKVTLAFCGDGASSEGDFHEALNIAAVWDLPVIFLIENNGYGLSTPNSEQFRFEHFTDKGVGYGIEAIQVDGNNVLEVYDAVRKQAVSIRRRPRPVLIEALTFRMRGHEEASGTKYVPEELFKKWAQYDPVENYEAFLLKEKVLSNQKINTLTETIKQEIDDAIATVDTEEQILPDTNEELYDVYAPFQDKKETPVAHNGPEKRFINAIHESLDQALEKYPSLILMGQDIAEYGGVFKATEGLSEKYGKQRVRNTPLCESGIIGTGLGLAVRGFKSIIEMQFADFVSCGFNQIINNLAKAHYRWGQNADVVIRMPTGAGGRAGPFHSQSTEAWFFHTPGLKVVYPSTAYDAKGLLNASIEDPNPILYYEHKKLYRSLSGPVPEEFYTVPIGAARKVREGEDITVITYGAGVHWTEEAIESLEEHISLELVDLRTLLPWDQETVKASVEKTGKVLLISEACHTGNVTGEIASWIAENAFEKLDAPVLREGSLDTPVPFSPELEDKFLPQDRIRDKIKELFFY